MTRHIILSLLLLLPFTVGAADWMARLSPDTRVCRLLIPGTHDAATGDGFMPADTVFGRTIAQTQEKSIADFRPDLTVADLRGRILVISRDSYGDVPRGGYAGGWSHSRRLADQTGAWIKGADPSVSARLMVQDFYDTSLPGGARHKRAAIKAMFGEKRRADLASPDACVCMINHASGYSLTISGIADEPVSLSQGYRDNAAHTNAFILRHLRSADRLSGIVLMDFAATDLSGGYDVMGKTLVEAMIERCCEL